MSMAIPDVDATRIVAVMQALATPMQPWVSTRRLVAETGASASTINGGNV
jgi:hypothetical protein